MGKEKVKSRTGEWGWLFENEWCPLFGELPFSPYPPSEPTSRCIQLIQDSRKLWDVPFLNGIPFCSFPTPKEILDWSQVSNYPKERILTARIIFGSSIHVWQYSIIQDARKDWYKKENDEFAPVNTMASVWETAVEYAREYLKRWVFSKQRDDDIDYAQIDYDYIESIPDYAFLAILVISEAWSMLSDILHWKEDEDSVYIRQQLQETTDLLNKATEIYLENKIKDTEKELDDIRPDHESKQKRIAELQQSNTERAKEKEEKMKPFLNEAIKIKRKISPTKKGSIRNIARLACEKKGLEITDPQKPPKEFQAIYKYLLKHPALK